MVKKVASSRSEGVEVKTKEYLIQHPDATLREIGDFLGISRQRVHVLLERMKLKTQRPHREKTLTSRQLEILRYVARGYTDKQIAEVMGLSAQSVRNQLHTIYAKLNVHKRKHAVGVVIEQGIMPPTDKERPEG
jgi:DNA-binding CsgD family transcriptional regulator